MDNRLLFLALSITLVSIGGLFLILRRLSRRESPAVPETAPTPAPTNRAVILRVLSTEKIDRHELRINLWLEVQPLDADFYETEASWIIRVGRIVGMGPGESFPIEITENGAVKPLMDWAKLWREGYAPPPRD